LERGDLTLVDNPRIAAHHDATDWPRWCEASLEAFEADHDGRRPEIWDEVQELIERYLKPMLMVRLGGIEPHARDHSALQRCARQVADAVEADRGTALKQLMRYVERYA
jgi:hypothetical protein